MMKGVLGRQQGHMILKLRTRVCEETIVTHTPDSYWHTGIRGQN